MLFQKRPFLSCCLLLIALTAFLGKAVLPAGFMPSVGKDGVTELVICSGTGSKTVQVPEDGVPSGEHSEKHPPCPYHLAVSQKSLETPFIALVSKPVSFVSVSISSRTDDYQARPITAPYPARGPPLSV
jgi:hypothetical protein